ncbi:uncharacterized protein LOC123516116, partial [Portunus trituberculatus]|uniref:uncharacterized protein LOC123516116 n=1 Tax=Portunus trituberculatus TaxID=210409 RepID=UPI001E1D0AB0
TADLEEEIHAFRHLTPAAAYTRYDSSLEPWFESLNNVFQRDGGELVTWAPSAVFSILSLIAAVLSIILPETKGCNLSEENKIEKHTDMRGKDNFGSLGDTDYQTRLMKTTETADDGESVTKENVIKHLTDEYKC